MSKITFKQELERINLWDQNFELGISHSNNIFLEFLEAYGYFTARGTLLDNDRIRKLFESYLVPRYNQWFVYDTDDSNGANRFVSKLCALIVGTVNKYDKVIKYYDDYADKLLVRIVTKTTLNDVPQIPDEDFSGNEYVSTIQQTETDPDTYINQLNNIRYKLVDIYNDWAGQFKDLFIVGGLFDEN